MAQQPFIFELNLNFSVTIQLPFVNIALFDCVVDWGDGSQDTITAYNDPASAHSYSPGRYIVTITGYCGGWSVNNGAIRNYLTDIVQFGTQTLFGTRAFQGCSLLTDVTATDLPGFRRGQEEYFFGGCPINLDLTNAFMGDGRLYRGFWGGGDLGDPSGWDLSRGEFFQSWLGGAEWNYDITSWKDTLSVGVTDRTVQTFDGFFAGNSIFNCGDAPGVFGNKMKWFNLGSGQIPRMFNGCASFNQDVSTNVQNAGQPDEYTAWDVSHCTDFSNLFSGTTYFNQDLSSWDTSSVTNMKSMFSNSQAFDQDLGSWNTSNVTSMEGMFGNSVFNNGGVGGASSGLDSWDVSKVTNFSFMFLRQRNNGFNHPIGSWTLRPASSINCSGMFQENYNFNQDIGDWSNTSSITNTLSMFRLATSFNNGGVGGVGAGLDKWDTSNITTMSTMFFAATSFNQPLASWNVGSCTNFRDTFNGASTFNQDLSNWERTTPDVSTLANVTNFGTMFRASAFNADISNWNVSGGTSFFAMFQNCSSFDQNLGAWTLASATNCNDMFYNSGMSDANLEATLYGWSLNPATATGVSAENIALNRTYPTGSNMDLALNHPTNGLVAAKGWNITGITIV